MRRHPSLRSSLVGFASALTLLGAANPSYGADAAPAAAPACAAPTKTVSFSKVIDLSHVIDQNIPLWPGDPSVVITTVATIQNDGYFLRKFTIGEHSATHMNAANSFIEGLGPITSYSAAQRVVPAVVIDVRTKCARNADYQLTKQDVLDWEARNGRIDAGSLVIMLTGWEDKWNSQSAFLTQDSSGNLHFPGFAGATTTWLLQNRQIAGVGIDTHGVDPGLDVNYSTNTQMAQNGKIALECMANLDQLPAKGATLILSPLQLRGGSGSPMDIVALLP